MASNTCSSYTVMAGDSGNLVAQKYGISFQSLVTANPDVSWETLEIGQVLQLPAWLCPTNTQDKIMVNVLMTVVAVLTAALFIGACVCWSYRRKRFRAHESEKDAELRKLRVCKSALESQVGVQERSFRKAETEARRIAMQLSDKRAEAESLRSQLGAEANATRRRLESAMQEREREKSQLVKQLRAMDLESSRLRSQLLQTEARYTPLQDERDDLQRQYDVLRRRYEFIHRLYLDTAPIARVPGLGGSIDR